MFGKLSVCVSVCQISYLLMLFQIVPQIMFREFIPILEIKYNFDTVQIYNLYSIN